MRQTGALKYGINEAARNLGISVDSLREWERQGTIPKAKRTPGGHRRYSDTDLDRINNIMAGK